MQLANLLPIPSMTPCSIWFGSSDFQLTMIPSEQALQKSSAKRGNVIKKSFFSIFSTSWRGGGRAARHRSIHIQPVILRNQGWGWVSCLLYIRAPWEAPRGLRPGPCLTRVTHPRFDSSYSLTFYQASPEAHKRATTTGLEGSLLNSLLHLC